MGPRVGDPDPGGPLTGAEARAWSTIVDTINGHWLGDFTHTQIEELIAGMVAQYPPDHEWAPKVADAIRERWRTQAAARLTDAWEQIKRGEGTGGV